jgi:hypothetical protein
MWSLRMLWRSSEIEERGMEMICTSASVMGGLGIWE